MLDLQTSDVVENILLDAVREYESSMGRQLAIATFRYPGHGRSELDRIMATALRNYENTTGAKLQNVVFSYERPEFGIPRYACDAR